MLSDDYTRLVNKQLHGYLELLVSLFVLPVQLLHCLHAVIRLSWVRA